MSERISTEEARRLAGKPGDTDLTSDLVADLLDARETISALQCEVMEEREEWQEATGLMCGDDPGGVTPESLRRHLHKLWELECAARVVDGGDLGGTALGRLRAALCALPKEM